MHPGSFEEWRLLFMLLIFLFVLIGLAEKFRTALRWPPEATRKFVHIVTGILIFFTPYFFISSLPLIILAAFFAIFNFLAIRFKLFKGIHGTKRPTLGTVYYPLAFLILLVVFWPTHTVIIQLSILILAIGDALAALVGENLKKVHHFRLTGDLKSLEGSAVMAIFSCLITLTGLAFLKPDTVFQLSFINILWISLITAVFATACEALGSSGSDNVLTPLGAAFVLQFMLTHSIDQNSQFTIGVLLAMFVAVLSFRFRFLNSSGSVTTFILGSVLFGIGSWNWGLPILAFFTSSSILSKMWRKRKNVANLMSEKSSKRDFGQVIANGGFPALIVLIFYITGNNNLFLIYLGALAAVTADTWGTEIGVLAKKHPRLITSLRPVYPGSSGAVSPLGTMGSISGSFFIAMAGFIMRPEVFQNRFFDILLITIAGLTASLIDSLVGATIQAQYKCPVCKKLTEKRVHCNKTDTVFFRGFKRLNNDAVNLICGFSGILFMIIAVYVF